MTPWTAADVPACTPHPASILSDAVLHFADVPIYAALATQWRAAGRAVPGQVDLEWAEAAAPLALLTTQGGPGDGNPAGKGLQPINT